MLMRSPTTLPPNPARRPAQPSCMIDEGQSVDCVRGLNRSIDQLLRLGRTTQCMRIHR